MRDVLIGIDAGTSVIKSIAFNFAGRQLGAHAFPNSYATTPGAGAEQDMARTWADTAATLRGLAETVPGLADRVAAIAVTGQGDGTWLIDARGDPVGPAFLWLDARAAAFVDRVRAGDADAGRYALTGSGLAACQQGPQLDWIKRNQPERIAAAAHAFHCKDWLYFNLTGEIATDPSEGCFTFGDFRARAYHDAVIDTLGLSDEKRLLPQIVEGTRESAPLSASAAAATGLPAGTPVVLGYVDVACTALGAGVYEPGATPGVTIVGSTGMHMRYCRDADDVTLNADRTGYTMCMPIPGGYAQMQSNMASTLNIDWLLDMASGLLATQGVERSRRDLIASLDGWVAQAGPANLLFQPYISEAGERGPFIDADARASFLGLSTRHGFADLVRGVFEGLAFAARDCYVATGAIPDEIRLTGGAARSRVLRGILSAATGAPVRTSAREEAGAAGAAMMAAVNIGVYDTMDACVAEWVTPLLGAAEPPDAELAARYDRVFPAYVTARDAMRPVWKAFAATKGHG